MNYPVNSRSACMEKSVLTLYGRSNVIIRFILVTISLSVSYLAGAQCPDNTICTIYTSTHDAELIPHCGTRIALDFQGETKKGEYRKLIKWDSDFFQLTSPNRCSCGFPINLSL